MPPQNNHSAKIGLTYGVICHAAFVTGVSMMIICMYFGMQVAIGPLKSPWSWFANIILLLQFSLVHSYLLSSRGRIQLQRLAPGNFASDLTTTTYVIIVSLQTLLLFSLWSPSGIIWWQAHGLTRVILTLIYIFAWLLLFKSMFDAGLALQTGFLWWRAVFRNVRPFFPPMPQQGMFRLCRQPIYFSFALTLWSVPVWTPDQFLLASVLTLYSLIESLFKERRFIQRYGDKFNNYRQQVSYWLPISPILSNKKNKIILNDQSVYQIEAKEWWTGHRRWLRILHNLVPARMDFFDSLIEQWHGMTVLDIGCGGGFMSEALARRGAVVTGVDPSAHAIEVARQHASAENLKINYLVGSGEFLPIASSFFDAVVIVDVLEHVKDINLVLSEIHRVLKPGGMILFDTINRTFLSSFMFILLGEKLFRIAPRGTHDPAMFIKPDELNLMLNQVKFEVGSFQGLGPVGLNRRLDITFGKLPIKSAQYIGYAYKRI